MKKVVLTFVAIFMAVMGMAQDPSVTINYDSIAPFEIKTSYVKNEVCAKYTIFSGDIGEAESWLPMVGSLEGVIRNFGIHCTNDTTVVWNQLVPNKKRVFYVLATTDDDIEVLITDTVSTGAWGGTGESVITIAISEVTDSSAHIVNTPNDQTAEFHTILVEKELFLEWGVDSLVGYLKEDPYAQYVVDDHVWPNLISGTDYKVLAVGKNINNEWGAVAVDSFKTTGVRPDPSVVISVDTNTLMATSFAANFIRNGVCDNYGIFTDTVGGLEKWKNNPMFGSLTLEQLVWQFSKKCTNDTLYNWNGLIPNQNYVIYAVANGDGKLVLSTDTIHTKVLGGEGLSKIGVEVVVLSDSSAHMTNMPNDQTALYKSFMITKAFFDSIGVDSVKTLLQEDLLVQYDPYEWTWTNLMANTEYYAVALGQNVNGEWGELAIDTFSTVIPKLTNTYDSITARTITVSFAKDENSLKYHLLGTFEGEIDDWLPMYGGDIAKAVIGFGIHCNADTTYTWKELIPNTNFVVYTVVEGKYGKFLAMDTVKTLAIGGEGVSVIAVNVMVTSDTSARVINTPNDQTASYRNLLVEQATFNEIGVDSILTILKEDPYVQYEVYDWNWLTLRPHTDYYALAIGQNINGEWGELTQIPFTTGTNSIDDVEMLEVVVYPNPTANMVKVMNVEEGSMVVVYDMQGRKMIATNASGNEMMIDMSSLSNGIYMLQVSTNNGIVGKGVRIIKK